MARQRDSSPTPGELEILNHLWDSGASELKTICAAIRAERPIATTTVATMLKLMLQKGLVQRVSGERGYLWKAKLTRTAAKRGLVGRLLDAAFAGSAHGLISHLLEDGQVSATERAEIEELLRQHRTEAPE
ncbi:MAG TPA: BlaI/MecI/CopY family transcriptional regulator [Planctomycetota bacterium]|nr:BlaI/MecI/CopY family transcriptional regulator [Planctomycetota bacterium]